MKFGDKLREMREAAGLTRDALAEKSGMSATAVKQYEHGVRVNIPVPAMLLLAKALGVSCEEFAACDYSSAKPDEPSPADEPKPAAQGKRK